MPSIWMRHAFELIEQIIPIELCAFLGMSETLYADKDIIVIVAHFLVHLWIFRKEKSQQDCTNLVEASMYYLRI